jgi:hypothetical protein
MNNGDALTQAMGEALRLDHDLFVNLAALRFIDAASASVIVRAGLSLPPDRRMTVVCRGLVRRVIVLCGARDAAQLRVREPYGRP